MTEPRAKREQAVRAVLTGEVNLDGIPVVATDPGKSLDPNLKNELAPRRSPPRIRYDKPRVTGALPAEVIRRIVRQRYGQLRACYTAGLSRNPNLQGQVTPRYVIAADGRVAQVKNAGSDLPDAGVIACVLKVYGGLTFPKPETGIVTVVGAVHFEPGNPRRR